MASKKQALRRETNRTVIRKLRKLMLENESEINCARCPYHRHENWISSQRSWKKFRGAQFRSQRPTRKVLEIIEVD